MQQERLDAIRAGLRAAPPIGRGKVDESLHRLQWNESPQDFPAELKEEVLQRLATISWSRYPVGSRPWQLIDALAAQMGVAPEQVVVSEGSADLIRAVMAATLHPNDVVVMPTPTFLLYRQNARLHEAKTVEIPLDASNGFALPVDALIAAARRHNAKLVTLCAPNNPTGTIYAEADLHRLASSIPSLLVIDEAYAEFCNQDLTALLPLGNVILLRTFSKFYAMAGVRVGYALTSPTLAAELQKVVTVFPLSVFSEIAALVALEQRERFLPIRDQVVAERERMAAALAALPGVTVYPSSANFLLIQLERPKQELLHHLQLRRRVLISDMASYPDLINCVRVSIGAPEQNDLVIRGFREVLDSA
ncbi:MAG: histidinol-phosphate aminotransferase 1 [Chloroflexota bacterium]|nr:histidinol-phosphate transaminase [Caldilinea sp.]GIK75736.1 MAG: histidinol-phosphate aminotransferase 1 [Chloroflexota bacterium]